MLMMSLKEKWMFFVVKVFWNFSHGYLIACNDTTMASPNGTTLFAEIGQPASVLFCVDTDELVYDSVLITKPFHRAQWLYTRHLNIGDQRKNYVGRNVTIMEVQYRDLNVEFSVDICTENSRSHEYSRYSDNCLTFTFMLREQGYLRPCNDTFMGSLNETTISAEIGRPLEVVFCVDSDEEVSSYVIITQPSHRSQWMDTKNNVIGKQEKGYSVKKILITEVQRRDLNVKFSVMIYTNRKNKTGPFYNKLLIFTFVLQEKGFITSSIITTTRATTRTSYMKTNVSSRTGSDFHADETEDGPSSNRTLDDFLATANNYHGSESQEDNKALYIGAPAVTILVSTVCAGLLITWCRRKLVHKQRRPIPNLEGSDSSINGNTVDRHSTPEEGIALYPLYEEIDDDGTLVSNRPGGHTHTPPLGEVESGVNETQISAVNYSDICIDEPRATVGCEFSVRQSPTFSTCLDWMPDNYVELLDDPSETVESVADMRRTYVELLDDPSETVESVGVTDTRRTYVELLDDPSETVESVGVRDTRRTYVELLDQSYVRATPGADAADTSCNYVELLDESPRITQNEYDVTQASSIDSAYNYEKLIDASSRTAENAVSVRSEAVLEGEGPSPRA